MKRTRKPTKDQREEPPKRGRAAAGASRGRGRGRAGGRANQVDVRAIVAAIKAKPGWERKVADPAIARRYAEEAAHQGASQATIADALRQLLECTTVDGSWETHIPVGVEDDRDYFLQENDDYDWTTTLVPLPYHSRGADDSDMMKQKNGQHGDAYPVMAKFCTRVVYELFYKDGLVPDKLRQRLEEQLDVIANAPEKDFHPGSNHKVQDLIHPSLYPYVRGASYEHPRAGLRRDGRKETAKRKKKDEEEEKVSHMEHDEEEEEEEEGPYHDPAQERRYVAMEREIAEMDSVYQWLPAEFDVTESGEVMIESYINNLDREKHAELYDTIAHVFRLFLPLFDKLLLFQARLGGKMVRKSMVFRRRLQVIVKAANYVLKPGDTYEGTWHVEGIPQERIVASGIYYYSTTSNIHEGGLAFRKKRDASLHDREQSHNLLYSFPLGKVDTMEGRCLAFLNTLQHKVKRLSNNSETVGVRKILCFFLIDPEERITSTADVPRQQWDQIKHELARTLIEVGVKRGVSLPGELIKYIVHLARWGFTKKEAQKHREVLMRERKYFVDTNNQLHERMFSFCEH